MASFDEMVAKMTKAPLRRGGGTYMGVGLFEVEILNTHRKMALDKNNFQNRNKELFIAEFKILSSNNPAHDVGSSSSWFCKDPSEGGSGDVKAFVLAAAGKDPRSVKDSDEAAQLQATLLAYAAMGEAEAFKRLGIPEDYFVGAKLRLETYIIKTKAMTDFTKHVWSPATT